MCVYMFTCIIISLMRRAVLNLIRSLIFLQRLVEFANKHLACVDRHVVDISHDFAGGDLFVILLGVLGRFFVPLSNYAIAPQSLSEKVGLDYAQEVEASINV